MKKIIYLKHTTSKKQKKAKIFSVIFMALGFLIISIALWPIISFNILVAPRFSMIVNPVPDNLLVKTSSKKGFLNSYQEYKGQVVEAQEINHEGESKDFTKASIWFPNKPAVIINQEDSVAYTISIPKLGIKDANVINGGEDLNKSLVQYGETASPGDYGNTVIFGHSVLPYFFNPSNYKTIFSFLPSLNEGDEIFVNTNGITYRYVIEEMRVVGLGDVSILEQRFDDSYLTLITCVPPGTYLKRLVVKAKLRLI